MGDDDGKHGVLLCAEHEYMCEDLGRELRDSMRAACDRRAGVGLRGIDMAMAGGMRRRLAVVVGAVATMLGLYDVREVIMSPIGRRAARRREEGLGNTVYSLYCGSLLLHDETEGSIARLN